ADGQTLNGVILNGTGSVVTYTPDPSAVGHDQFGYTVSDPVGGQSSAIVNITISPLMSPTVTSTVRSGNSVVLSGTGGAPYASFHVVASTDLSLPLTLWTPAGAGNFDGAGHFSFSTPISSGNSQVFYIVEAP